LTEEPEPELSIREIAERRLRQWKQ